MHAHECLSVSKRIVYKNDRLLFGFFSFLTKLNYRFLKKKARTVHPWIVDTSIQLTVHPWIVDTSIQLTVHPWIVDTSIQFIFKPQWLLMTYNTIILI